MFLHTKLCDKGPGAHNCDFSAKTLFCPGALNFDALNFDALNFDALNYDENSNFFWGAHRGCIPLGAAQEEGSPP